MQGTILRDEAYAIPSEDVLRHAKIGHAIGDGDGTSIGVHRRRIETETRFCALAICKLKFVMCEPYNKTVIRPDGL